MADHSFNGMSPAELLLRMSQGGSGGTGNGTHSQQQQQQAAMAALQSAQLAAVLQSGYGNPFSGGLQQFYNPYAAMYSSFGAAANPFSGGNVPGTVPGMGWPGGASGGGMPSMSDYMANMVAMQGMQGLQSQTTESFADILRKMPQPPTSTSEGKTHPPSSSLCNGGTTSKRAEDVEKKEPDRGSSSRSGSSQRLLPSEQPTASQHNSKPIPSPSPTTPRPPKRDSEGQRTPRPNKTSKLDTLALVASALTTSTSSSAESIKEEWKGEEGKKVNGEETLQNNSATATPNSKPPGPSPQPQEDLRPPPSDAAAAPHTQTLQPNTPSASLLPHNTHSTTDKKNDAFKMDTSLLLQSPPEPGEIVHSSKKRPARTTSVGSQQAGRSGTGEPQKKVAKTTEKTKKPPSSASSLAQLNNLFANGDPSNISQDVHMDPRLLNASAVAWAALSNQILLGSLGELFRQSAQQPSTSSSSTATTTASKQTLQDSKSRSGSNRRKSSIPVSSRGRPSTISASDSAMEMLMNGVLSGRDPMDETIDRVIKDSQTDEGLNPHSVALPSIFTGLDFQDPDLPLKERGGKRPSPRGSRKGSGVGVQTPTGGGSESGSVPPSGMTVRDQLGIKRNEVGSEGAESVDGISDPDNVLPLDLSTKTSNRSTPMRSEDEMIEEFEEGVDGEGGGYPRKRKVAEENMVRIPLRLGWRRQTCIRTVSANGVRGDVMYYAPCGKKLGSYAEVIRYLNKHNVKHINRDNFSFSCKVLVGEFLQINSDSHKNGIVKLTEDDITEKIEMFSKENGNRRSLSENSLSRLEQAQLKLWERKKEKEREQHLKAQRVLEAMKRAKEQEIKKQQLAFLQKQGEEYYRQMLLMGLEREKMRQQIALAKAREMKAKQEERQRLLAERVIRQQEKQAAKDAHQQKMRQMRQPCEDMEFDDIKPLPQLERIPGLEISGPAFADLTMVMEFIENFAHVLKIDFKDDVPKMEYVHAGLLNDPQHVKALRDLTKLLLTLVLEYPGLRSGHGKTFIGQNVRELKITRDSQSELLRMFLNSRDAQGKELGSHLKDQCFEACTPDVKCGILAYMCNELLYCRNVVREIEGNIEEVAKLRGDKWAKEGKVRSLRTLQARKRVDENRARLKREREEKVAKVKTEPLEETPTPNPPQNNTDDANKFSISPVKKEEVERETETPSSVSESIASDVSEQKTVAQVKEEMRVKNQQDKQREMEEDEDMINKVKKIVPGINPPDAITEEERVMTIEDLEKVVEGLNEEVGQLRHKINDTNDRVRTLPFGEDRYHRLYWVLPHNKAFVVESMESSVKENPAWSGEEEVSFAEGCNTRELCPDVVDCVFELVNTVSSSTSSPLKSDSPTCSNNALDLSVGRSEDESPRGKGVRRRTPPIPYSHRRGWWCVRKKEHLEELLKHFLNRGIRERLLQRTLVKADDAIHHVAFSNSQEGMRLLEVGKRGLSDTEMDCIALRKVSREIQDFEAKVFHANIHCRQWKPAEMVGTTSEGKSSTSPPQEESEHSEESSPSPAPSLPAPTTPAPTTPTPSLPAPTTPTQKQALIRQAKHRLLLMEQAIERRYLRMAFHHSTFNPDSVLSTHPNTPRSNTPETPADLHDGDDSQLKNTLELVTNGENPCLSRQGSSGSAFDEVPLQLEKWRTGVNSATNPAQLMLCVIQLDSNIAWEKSIMRASCQICRSGDNESQLLLCDGCDMGFHTYCFRPRMDSIPQGDWFCPDCVSKATDKPCCLICCKDAGEFLNCGECGRDFHPECIDLPATAVKKAPSRTPSTSSLASSATPSWLCAHCSKTVIPKLKSLENGESGGVGTEGAKKTPKTKKKPKAKVNPSPASAPPTPPPKKLTIAQSTRVMMKELDAHKDSWPFKLPVDTKKFPLYKKVIKKPMDLALIASKVNSNKYVDEESFAGDMNLIFENCRVFNEDDSPVGKAGHSLKKFFNKRWKEVAEPSS